MKKQPQQPTLRKVIRPPKGDNITLAQARRMFREIKREEEARRKADATAGCAGSSGRGALQLEG